MAAPHRGVGRLGPSRTAEDHPVLSGGSQCDDGGLGEEATYFSCAFRSILKDTGVEPVRLPARSPNLNSQCRGATSDEILRVRRRLEPVPTTIHRKNHAHSRRLTASAAERAVTSSWQPTLGMPSATSTFGRATTHHATSSAWITPDHICRAISPSRPASQALGPRVSPTQRAFRRSPAAGRLP